MANPQAQDKQELRGALRCEVFSKNVSKYTEQGGKGEHNANTQSGFRARIKAEHTDQRQPSGRPPPPSLRPCLHCPLVARQGHARGFKPSSQGGKEVKGGSSEGGSQGLEPLKETRSPPLHPSATGLVQPLLHLSLAPNNLSSLVLIKIINSLVNAVLSAYTHYLPEFLQQPLEVGSVPPRDEQTHRGSQELGNLSNATWYLQVEKSTDH